MQGLITAFSYLAVSQLIFTGLFFLFFHRNSRLGLLTTLLCVCLISVNCSPFPAAQYPILNYIDGRIAAATLAVLWLFGHALFIDDRKITPLAWFFLIGYQIPRGFVAFPEEIYSFAGNPLLQILNPICLLIAFGLAVHVIVMAVKEFGNDLMEERRRLRGPFAAGLGIMMAMGVATLLAPNVLGQEWSAAFTQVAIIVTRVVSFSFFLMFNLVTFRLSTGSQLIIDSSQLETSEKPARKPRLAEADLELVRELDRRMKEEKLYTRPELTIGQLAELFKVQEYKLRVMINRELGYKNFNQFLNFYRINEACEQLARKSRHRNIAIVAQDVGYSSLSTFNQAFRTLKGITPTEYKAQHADASAVASSSA